MIKNNQVEILNTFSQIHQSKCKANKIKLSLSTTEHKLQDYEKLRSHYHTFEKKTDQLIPQLLAKYKQEWDNAEKEWYNWDIKTVTAWFEYIVTKNGSADHDKVTVDFNMIKSNLAKACFRAKYLAIVDDSDLIDYGFKNENDCNLLYQRISCLIEKYPLPRKNANKSSAKADKKFKDQKQEEKQSVTVVSNDDDKEKQIKKEHLCPISQTVMKHPVIAFDGNTYDKESLIKFLNDNGKMPNTSENACNIEMAIADLTVNRAIKQEIENNDNHNGEAKIATDELEQEDFDIDLITSGEKQKSASVDDQAPPKKRQRVE